MSEKKTFLIRKLNLTLSGVLPGVNSVTVIIGFGTDIWLHFGRPGPVGASAFFVPYNLKIKFVISFISPIQSNLS